MAKTATITARIDPNLKEHAENVFSALGLTTSQAITLFYRQVQLQQGLPFEVRLIGSPSQKASSVVRESSVRGKYAYVPTSAEEFARRKQEEKTLEEDPS